MLVCKCGLNCCKVCEAVCSPLVSPFHPPSPHLYPTITPSPPFRPRHHVSIPSLPYPTTGCCCSPFLLCSHFILYGVKPPACGTSLSRSLHTWYVNITKLSMMTFWIPNQAGGERVNMRSLWSTKRVQCNDGHMERTVLDGYSTAR